MGSAWVPRIQPKAVKRTVIVEIDQDIIDRYFHKLNPDWEIIRFDAWKFHTEDRFDFIFIDIWDSIILDKYMKIIENKYSNFLNPEGKVIFLESIRVF
jgi:16S rRNA G966 N2-methylase RsmD